MLISNDYELQLIRNSTGLSVQRLLEMVGTIVTTKADEGCEVVTKGGTATIPAVPGAQVVDPTGAGDAFRGGLIKGLVEGCPVERAVANGRSMRLLCGAELRHPGILSDSWMGLAQTLQTHYGG